MPVSRILLISSALLLAAVAARGDDPDWAAMAYTLHADFQAVDANGFGTFPLNDPIKMRGVLLNDSAEMLDPTPGAAGFLGGLWQIWIQTVEQDDFGGTACWMGQYIGKIVGNHPDGSYSDAEWLAELDRLSHDPSSGYEFQVGDLVEVRARAPGLHYRGKNNINEKHLNVPEMDFDVVLLTEAYGLPTPIVITLTDLKDANDEFIWDQTRQTGPEHYQATLVRINDVTLVDPAGWAPDAVLTIQGGTGRTFPLKLGLGDGFEIHDPPSGAFDVIAIMDQEDENPDDGHTDGYRLWVASNYDGNGYAIPAIWDLKADMNCDGLLNGFDIDPFILALNSQAAYEAAHPDCRFEHADVNGDGLVNGFDVDPFIDALLG